VQKQKYYTGTTYLILQVPKSNTNAVLILFVILKVNGTYVNDVQLQVSFARHQPVTEIITDTSGAATWTATAANQSQKATHKDKRNQETYGQDFPF